MSITKTINGNTYRIPVLGDSAWGAYTTDFLAALVDAAILTGSAATKPLVAELDLGDSFGVQTCYVKSNQANPASSGLVRLANGDVISWRNGANSDDIYVTAARPLAVPPISPSAGEKYFIVPTATGDWAGKEGQLATYSSGNWVYEGFSLASTDRLIFNGAILPTLSSTDSLTNKTIDADSNTISNLEVDNLKSGVLDTDLSSVSASDDTIPSAKATKTYVDAVSTGLNNHLIDTTDAHAASAIGVIPAGNLAATTVQAALEEIQSDVDSRLAGMGTVTDNRLIKTQGTTGTAFEQTGISVDDSNNMSGADNISATSFTGKSMIRVEDTDNSHYVALRTNSNLSSNVTIDLPVVNGTLATLAGTETLTNKYFDGGTASANNKLKLPSDTYANLVSLAGKAEGQLYYATDTDKVYYYDGTNLQPVGSGSGSGEKNYITNPSAATDTTGWVASSANIAVARTTTTAQCPREFTTATAISLTSSTDEAYARFRFSLDDADLSKKLKATLAFINADTSDAWRIDVWKNSASDYSGTYTELTLSTDSSGNSYLPVTTGVYNTTFDTDTTAYIELRIVHNGTNSDVLYISDVLVGPGSVIQGAVVEEWKSYTPTGNLSTNITYTGKYCRVGTSVSLKIKATFSGANTQGKLKFTIAQLLNGLNLSINTNAIPSNSPSEKYIPLGSWQALNANAGSGYGGLIRYRQDTDEVLLYGLVNNAQGADFDTSVSQPFGIEANDTVSIMISELPIAEWAGSGVVNLAQNDVEYASNSSVTNADDTTSFAYGPSGSKFPAVATSLKCKQVRFQSPIQPTDKLSLEIWNGVSSVWVPVEVATTVTIPFAAQASNTYGIGFQAVAGVNTDIAVYFGIYRALSNSSTYGAAGQPFSEISNNDSFRWRVRKTAAGVATGFGIVQPGVSAGLVSASGLPGRTDGAAVASGYVGQTVITTLGPTAASNTNTVYAIGSYTPTAGKWLLFINGYINETTTTGNGYVILDINTSVALRSAEYYGRLYWNESTVSLGATPFILDTTGSTTVYALGQYGYSTLGDSTMKAVITAVRIA